MLSLQSNSEAKLLRTCTLRLPLLHVLSKAVLLHHQREEGNDEGCEPTGQTVLRARALETLEDAKLHGNEEYASIIQKEYGQDN